MRFITAIAGLAAALTLTPGPAPAEVTLGANFGSARTDGGDFEGSDTGWKVHLGSSFQQFIGGEIGYIDFGNLGGDGPRANAWTPAITVGVPLGLARIYGKGGVAFADVEGDSLREEYRNEEPFYGVGLRLGVSPGLGFRAEYERYSFDNEDVDMAQAGLEFNF
jgi:hypothetical protein